MKIYHVSLLVETYQRRGKRQAWRMVNILFEKEYLIFVSTFHYFYDLVFTACVVDLISICRCPPPPPKTGNNSAFTRFLFSMRNLLA